MSFVAILLSFTLTSLQKDSLQADTYFKAYQSSRYNNPGEAILFLDSAIRIANQISNLSLTAEYLRNKGIHLKNQGELTESLEVYKEAMELFRQVKDSSGIAATYNNIGISHFRMASYDQALSSYFEAKTINLSIEDFNGLSKNYIAIGNVYSYRHQYDEALINYKEAESVLSGLDNISLKALVTKNIGLMYSEEDNPKYDALKAIEYNQQSINNYRILGDSFNIAGLYHNLGLLYENESELDKAEEYYNRGLALRESFDLRNDMANSHFNLGNVHLKKQKVNLAKGSFEKSFQLAELSDNIGLQRNAAKRLSEVYAQLEKSDLAFEYLSLYDSLDNVLYNVEKIEIINELETKYETERKEKELAQAQVEIERRIAERDGFLITLAVFLVLAIILIIIYQQRQKAIRTLSKREKDLHNKRVNELLLEQEVNSLNAMLDGQEKERKRISRELHDRVGSLLTAAKYSFESTEKKSNESKVLSLLDEALDEARNLSHSLASGVLAKFGLVAAVSDLKTSIECDRDIEVKFEHVGFDGRINNEIEIDLYRIIQELVSNSLKHSFAKRLEVSLDRRDNTLTLTYQDDGIGFDTRMDFEGIGLRNIEARSIKYNGKLSVESQPSNGMKLSLKMEIYPDEKTIIG
ncbi:MAG: tetratricopeptide repeat protein [Cyclobacteriaceae bacterium]